MPQGIRGSNPRPSASALSLVAAGFAKACAPPLVTFVFLALSARVAKSDNPYVAHLIEAAQADYKSGHVDSALTKLDRATRCTARAANRLIRAEATHS
jgi:hypothetical protein